jgi:hypothetical protein
VADVVAPLDIRQPAAGLWPPPLGAASASAPARTSRPPLQSFCTIRSETRLIEQLDYNLLYRRFVGLGIDEAVWVPTVFTKNRDRLLEAEVARIEVSMRASVLTKPP